MPDKPEEELHNPEEVVADYLNELLPPTEEKAGQSPPAPESSKPSEPAENYQHLRSHRIRSSGKLVQRHGPADRPDVNVPEWAQQPFESLIFDVAGLKLAVPLTVLGGVQALNGGLTANSGLTSLPAMPDWFLGLFRGERSTIRVINTSLWIMPERYKSSWLMSVKFLVCLDGSDWAMACNGIGEVCTLNPQQIKWRTNRSKRPWIAGTLTDQLCVLVDAQAILRQLDAAGHKKL